MTGSRQGVLAHRDLRLLLGGQAASQTGDWLYSVSLLAFVYTETRSPTWVAVAGVVRLLPYLFFGTLGGVVADRYERRAVMIASDLIRAVTMFSHSPSPLPPAPWELRSPSLGSR